MKLLRTTGIGDNIRNIKNEGNRRLRRFSVPLLPKALLPLPQSEETAIPPRRHRGPARLTEGDFRAELPKAPLGAVAFMRVVVF
jgi:hypothetical protein